MVAWPEKELCRHSDLQALTRCCCRTGAVQPVELEPLRRVVSEAGRVAVKDS
jgi:hypothetical protein